MAAAGLPGHSSGSTTTRSRLKRSSEASAGVVVIHAHRSRRGGKNGRHGEMKEVMSSVFRAIVRAYPTPPQERSRHNDSRNHPRHHRKHARRQDPAHGAAGVTDVRQVRGLQPAVLGQGPAGDRDHRGRRAARDAQARPDRRRGDLRQHRDRARDGLRGQGLSLRRDHVRQLLRRAAEAHADPRGEGHPEPRGRARHRGWSKKAEELAKKHGWFLARQFENPANPEYHRNTTGPRSFATSSGTGSTGG